MANARDINLDIIGHDKTKPATQSAAGNLDTLRRKMDAASNSSKSFGQKFKGGVQAAAPYAKAGALALVALGGAAIKAASQAEQSIGASQTVFGKYAGSIISNSKKAAEQYGLSANEYRENANLIGSLFKNQGVSLDQLAGKTDNMIGVAADLSATFGGTTKDAVESLGSAFKGEFDPLEKYGISLNQSKINAYLAAHGQDKLTGSALAQAKQQATTKLIMDQAKDSLGAFAGESDTTAHKQQVLSAKTKDLAAKFGEKLLPAVNKVLDAAIKFGDWASEHPAEIKALAVAIGAVALSMGALNLAFLASPIGLVILGLAALAAGFVYLWTKSQTFRVVMTTIFAAVGVVILTFVGLVLRAFKLFLQIVLGVFGAILKAASAAFGWIPGIGDKIKGANKAFQGFKDNTIDAIDGAIKKTDEFRDNVAKMPKEIKIKGNIDDLKSKIDAAKAKLKEKGLTDPQKSKIRADISDLQAKLRQAKSDLAALKGKTINVKVVYQQPSTGNMIVPGHGHFSAGSSFAALEAGSGVSRVGGPAAQRMPDIHLDGSTSVYLDGELMTRVARREVVAAGKQQAHRAKYGRR